MRTSLEVKRLQMQQTPVVVHIRDNAGKLGRVAIYGGSIEWYPGSTKTRPYRLTWKRFADLVEQTTSKRKLAKQRKRI